jgi:predicted nucleotidyltransferase
MKVSSIQQIVSALNAAEVRFIVVGGLAVVAHGYGRQTQDVDLVIPLDSESVHRLFATLDSLGYRPRVPVTADQFADPAQRAQWVEEKGMTVLNFHSEAHRETPLDIFVTEPFDFGGEHQSAVVSEVAPGVPVRIVTLATLIRMKRQAARPQDMADIAELLQANPEAQA